MSSKIALLIDDATSRDLASINLEGESLAAQQWLSVYTDANEARKQIKASTDLFEAWVVSNDEVAPINLAATIKQDRPDIIVRLVASDRGGSLLSRAHTASIDEVLAPAAFARRYADAKRAALSVDPVQCTMVPAIASTAVGAKDRDLQTPQEANTFPEVKRLQKACNHPGVNRSQETSNHSGVHRLQETSNLQEVNNHLARKKTKSVPAQPIAAATGSTFLLPVVSGSGGAGKSAVSVMGALMASRLGFKTLLLDYDLQFGDVAALLGKENALCINEALDKKDGLQRCMQSEGVAILAAPARLEEAELCCRQVPELLSHVAPYFDVIIANTGSAWAEQHAALLERCSAALFLIDQRASSLRACNHALELCSRCGIATSPFQFALNRCTKGSLFNPVDISGSLQGRFVFEIRDGGHEVEEYLGAGGASELLSLKNEFCTSLEHVFRHVLPDPPAPYTPVGQAESLQKQRKRGRHTTRRKRGTR